MPRIPHVSLAALCSLGLLVACGGKGGEVVRPTDYNATKELGAKQAKCGEEPKLATPLVIDLEPDQRQAFEVALKGGVIVVAYDCNQLRVLPTCRVPTDLSANYKYVGTSKNEKVLQLKGADELKVNLPLSAGKLGGEVQSGRSIDIGLVYAGVQTNIVGGLKRADLTGTCEGATHYVQSASVGAFAVATGSGGKVAAAGELFSIGASGSSESSRKSQSSNGSLDACRKADPDAEKPPGECRAPLTVELTPLLGKAAVPVTADAKPADPKADGADSKAKPVENPCPEGFVLSEGKCAKPSAEAFLCNPRKPEECKEQCDKGSTDSCYNYGAYLKNNKDAEDDAVPVFKKSCDAGRADGCAYQGFMMARQKDPSLNKEITGLFKLACEKGSGQGCFFYSTKLSKSDPAGSQKALHRGCGLGNAGSCSIEAINYFQGKGVPKDIPQGLAVYQDACQSGNSSVCGSFVRTLWEGELVPQDLPRAYAVSKKLCDKAATPAVFSVECETTSGILQDMGKLPESFELAKKACNQDTAVGCKTLAKAYDLGKGTKKDKAAADALYKKICADELTLMMDGMDKHPVCNRPGIKK